MRASWPRPPNSWTAPSRSRRLLGSPPALAGNLFNRSVVALAVGDLDLALASAEEGVELTRHLDDGFVTAWAAVRLAGALLESGQPDRAVELLLGRAGGEELTLIPGGWRAYCLELLTRCWLALDRRGKAERAAAHRGRSSGPAASPRYRLGRSRRRRRALRAETARAIERALASADAARSRSAHRERARARRSRVERWRKPARPTGPWRSFSGQQQRSTRAALRYRDSAERELGKLGLPHRRTHAGNARMGRASSR